uniref:Melanocortin 2 receptor accessory protein n=1 Tax=Cyprinodon variegatus TaxID=28743 RepID=A0A3Q2FPH9_CYPVA
LANFRRNRNTPPYEWEYYFDYLDPVFVDESQLKYHKYSIVIILWISLAAFVGFLFLILNLMSLGLKLPKKKNSPTNHHLSKMLQNINLGPLAVLTSSVQDVFKLANYYSILRPRLDQKEFCYICLFFTLFSNFSLKRKYLLRQSKSAWLLQRGEFKISLRDSIN